ncbi:PAS domain S-box protein [Streptomyces sp. NPDC002205]|uniref:PAS domain S-box protein n=1 Tax=Streptomyces sp. NPDC002205 TaxID=3154411 RepID=UPI00331E155D
MDSSTQTAITPDQAAFQTAGAAIALLHAKGTVVGRTRAAQRLIGYSAAEVVGRSAALLTAVEDRAEAAALAENRAPSRWSGFTTVRHRNGHRINVRVWVQSLSGQDGRARWTVSATDKATLPSRPADGSTVQSLPTALHML